MNIIKAESESFIAAVFKNCFNIIGIHILFGLMKIAILSLIQRCSLASYLTALDIY